MRCEKCFFRASKSIEDAAFTAPPEKSKHRNGIKSIKARREFTFSRDQDRTNNNFNGWKPPMNLHFTALDCKKREAKSFLYEVAGAVNVDGFMSERAPERSCQGFEIRSDLR